MTEWLIDLWREQWGRRGIGKISHRCWRQKKKWKLGNFSKESYSKLAFLAVKDSKFSQLSSTQAQHPVPPQYQHIKTTWVLLPEVDEAAVAVEVEVTSVVVIAAVVVAVEEALEVSLQLPCQRNLPCDLSGGYRKTILLLPTRKISGYSPTTVPERCAIII